MNMKKCIVTSISLILVAIQTSCTTKGAYEAFQYNHASACREYRGQQQDDCLANYSKSFEEYQKERTGYSE